VVSSLIDQKLGPDLHEAAKDARASAHALALAVRAPSRDRGAVPDNEPLCDEALLAAMEQLGRCDGYLVLVVDTASTHVDAFGPYDGLTAVATTERLRGELEDDGPRDSVVGIVRLHNS